MLERYVKIGGKPASLLAQKMGIDIYQLDEDTASPGGVLYGGIGDNIMFKLTATADSDAPDSSISFQIDDVDQG